MMYTKVKQTDEEIGEGRGGISTMPGRIMAPVHSGKRRCVILSACLFFAFVTSLTLPVVGPMLKSVLNGGAASPPPSLPPTKSDEEIEDERVVNDLDNLQGDDKINLANNREFEENEKKELLRKNVTISPEMLEYASRCPNWSDDLRDRFMNECPYWVSKFAKWESTVTSESSSVAYICQNDYECHGWGDRVGGMQSAFNKALDLGRRFDIRHANVKRVLQSCLFRKQAAIWSANDYVPIVGQCSLSRFNCQQWNDRKACGEGKPWVAYQVDRTCISERHCQGIAGVKPDFNVVNLFGCNLRAMFEPTTAFLAANKFPFRYDGKTEKLTLTQIHELMSKYYIISVHMRLGDGVAFTKMDSDLGQRKKQYLMRPMRCASTLESFKVSNEMVGGKEVRYLVASDSAAYKKMIWAEMGDKVMSFAFIPSHIAFGPGASDARILSEEIAEWVTLGRGDDLIVNKVTRGWDIYKGRFSGFAGTSWIYQLKHLVYDAGRCMSYSIPLDGIYEENRGSCIQSPWFSRGLFGGPQPQLDLLVKANLTFPQSFVANGEIVSTKSGQDDDDIEAFNRDEP